MDFRQIKELLREFDKSGLSAMKIKKDDMLLELEKAVSVVAAPVHVAAPATMAAPAPMAAPVATPELMAQPIASAAASSEMIRSPMVGTFYSAPSPGSAPFVKVGDRVKKGQVVAILEAMKIMNELEAEFDCKVLDVLVKDGQPVEFDMPLFVVEKL